jgi:hypothetical protein
MVVVPKVSQNPNILRVIQCFMRVGYVHILMAGKWEMMEGKCHAMQAVEGITWLFSP